MAILIICKSVVFLIQCLFRSFPLPYLKTLISCKIRSWLEVVCYLQGITQTLLCCLKSQSLSWENLKDYKCCSLVLCWEPWLEWELQGLSFVCVSSVIYSTVPKVNMIQSGVGYTWNLTPETQLKLQAFIPPAPGCKWERPTANLGPSEVSKQHFCLYFFEFF